jgi:hypothetical protein
MPNFSLDPNDYARMMEHLPPQLAASIEESAQMAEESGARLMTPQSCDLCLTTDALTTYGWPRNLARRWEQEHVCGSCRWRLEGNKVTRTVTDPQLEMSQEIRDERLSGYAVRAEAIKACTAATDDNAHLTVELPDGTQIEVHPRP